MRKPAASRIVCQRRTRASLGERESVPLSWGMPANLLHMSVLQLHGLDAVGAENAFLREAMLQPEFGSLFYPLAGKDGAPSNMTSRTLVEASEALVTQTLVSVLGVGPRGVALYGMASGRRHARGAYAWDAVTVSCLAHCVGWGGRCFG